MITEREIEDPIPENAFYKALTKKTNLRMAIKGLTLVGSFLSLIPIVLDLLNGTPSFLTIFLYTVFFFILMSIFALDAYSDTIDIGESPKLIEKVEWHDKQIRVLIHEYNELAKAHNELLLKIDKQQQPQSKSKMGKTTDNKKS